MSKNEVIYRNAQTITEAIYPGLTPQTYVLPAGTVVKDGGMPLACDVLVEQDVSVVLRDGTTIRTDVYRPNTEGRYPTIMGWSPYGKRRGILSVDVFGHTTRMDVPVAWEDGLNKFEGPNPSYWVAHGYVVLAPDPRGIFMSEGDFPAWGKQDARDEFDVIEWAAAQQWSNGKVGLTGNSWLAMSQWFVAAEKPPHLAAIAPWEGASDIYRDTSCRGGIPELMFAEGIFSRIAGQGRVEDIPAMTREHPFYDGYWASKVPDFEKIEIAAYVVASWTNLLHSEGTFRGWRSIASKEKWLRVNNTHEWTDYYQPPNVEDLRRFFDRYLKGKDNGWESTPRVRLSVLDPGGRDTIGRAEAEFPLARQTLLPLYLDAGESTGTLRDKPQGLADEASYDSADATGISFRFTFVRDTEVTGYINLKLWVEARGHDDMDLFAFVRKIDRSGAVSTPQVVTDRSHLGPNGRLRISLRALDPLRSTSNEPYQTFERSEKLSPGEIVPVQIGFWPYAMRWHAGETLELVITGTDMLVRPEFPQIPPIATLNQGRHVIHFGGRYDSHLLLPVIP